MPKRSDITSVLVIGSGPIVIGQACEFDYSGTQPPPPPAGQTVDTLVEQVEEAAPYYDLRYRRTASSVVVASSGFAQPEGGGWQLMAANSLLVVDRATLEIAEHPLGVELVPAGAASVGDELR